MPRDGTETYVLPFPDVVEDTTIESTVYNGFTSDVAQDLNTPRPIKFGGTGADNVTDAMTNLGGELAKQVVTNYDSAVLIPGSFYSASTATAAPINGHAFSGICYLTDANNMFLEASDQDDSTQPGAKYIRQKKAGVWSVWQKVAGVSTGTTPPTGAGDNTLWWDPTLGKLFVYYNDGNTKQWVETNAVPDVDPNTYVEIAGDIMTGPLTLNANPTTALHAATKQYVDAGDAVPLRGWIAGLTLSTPGSSTTFITQPGEAANSTNAYMMTLGGAGFNKTTSAWAVGHTNGGLDTGTVAANTWYHVYLIKRLDTGVVDLIFSLSASAPTLPANYTIYRRIGSIRTNASSQWTAFVQKGDEFLWVTPLNDVSAFPTSTALSGLTLTVPTGVKVWAKFIGLLVWGSVGGQSVFSDPDTPHLSSASPAFYHVFVSAAGQQSPMDLTICTNTSAQVICSSQAAGCTIYVNTYGWVDRRGRDA